MSALATPTARLVLAAGAPEADWHAARALGLGGSDLAAILGMDRHKAPLAVWHDKRGTAPDDYKPAFVKRAAEAGRRLEPVIAQWFADESHRTVLPTRGTLAHVDADWMRVNLDGEVIEPGDIEPTALLECKNRSQYQAAEWGADEDNVPDEPAIQSLWGMAVTGYKTAYLAALIGGNDLRWYRLEPDEELLAHIADHAATWWRTHVLEGVQPAPGGSKADTELLAHLWDVAPGAIAQVDEAEARLLRARRDELTEQAKTIKTALAQVENQMKVLTGDAEIAMAAGWTVWTWKQNGTFAAKRFREAEPDLAAELTRPAPGLDMAALKAEHPVTYQAHRARVLRVPGDLS